MQGWIDITYLSQDGKLRLTRGNKGVLDSYVKKDQQQKLSGPAWCTSLQHHSDMEQTYDSARLLAWLSKITSVALLNPIKAKQHQTDRLCSTGKAPQLWLTCNTWARYVGINSMLVVTGTLFVLMKDPSPKQKLLDALDAKQSDEEVQELIEQLQSQSPIKQAAASPKAQGRWRLLWSQQASQTNLLQNLT